jgi:hypothetical protein
VLFASYSTKLVPNGDQMVPAWTLRHLNPDCSTLRLTRESGLRVNAVKNDAILQDNTSRCRAFGCWDTYEAEWCDGAVVAGIVPARLSGSTTKAQALFKHLRAHVPGRGYSRDPLTGGHLIYLIAPPGSARLTRGHTGYRPSRPECYIGECEVGQWRRPRLRRHLTRAVTEAGEPEFLTELLRQGYQPFAEVIEYGHENRSTARRAEEDFCDIAERFGWSAGGGRCNLGFWKLQG